MTIKISYTQNFRWSVSGEPFLATQAFTPLYLNLITWEDSNKCSLGFEKEIKPAQPHDKREKAHRFFTIFGLGSILANIRISLYHTNLDILGDFNEYEHGTLYFGYNKTAQAIFVADWEGFNALCNSGDYRRAIWGKMQEVKVTCYPLAIRLALTEVRE